MTSGSSASRRKGGGIGLGRSRAGFLMPMAMIILVAVTALGFAALSLAFGEMTQANREADGCKAFFLAEAGVQRALYELAVAGSWSSVPGNMAQDEALGDGTYTVRVTTDGDAEATIVAEGQVNGRLRRVSVTVQRP